MNTNLICSFKSGEQALSWAVVEQAIIDYRETNSQSEREPILDFLFDFLPKDIYIKIRRALNE